MIYKKIFVLVFLFLVPFILVSQNKVLNNAHHWGFKIGLGGLQHQIKEVSLSGGHGLGCHIYHDFQTQKIKFAAKIGFYYQLFINPSTSLIIGPEILIPSQNMNSYEISYWCIDGQRSNTKGHINFTKVSYYLPLLIRKNLFGGDLFLELGGYHDLGLSLPNTYDYQITIYKNEMAQPYPQPKVNNGQNNLVSQNYGLIFGIGKPIFMSSKYLECRVNYYLGLSKYIPLGEYRYVRNHSIDVSVNLRFGQILNL